MGGSQAFRFFRSTPRRLEEIGRGGRGVVTWGLTGDGGGVPSSGGGDGGA